MTSFGRSQLFGTCYAWGSDPKWTCLIDRLAVVTGIHVGSTFNVGIASTTASEALSDVPSTMQRPTVPPTFSKFTHYFLTAASICGVKRIQKCKGWKDRCTGLLIEREDGMINVLGRFEAADAGSIHTIYKAATDGPLSGLAFLRAASLHEGHHVKDVLPVIGDSPPPPGYKVFRNTVSNVVNCGLWSFTDG